MLRVTIFLESTPWISIRFYQDLPGMLEVFDFFAFDSWTDLEMLYKRYPQHKDTFNFWKNQSLNMSLQNSWQWQELTK